MNLDHDSVVGFAKSWGLFYHDGHGRGSADLRLVAQQQ